MCFECFQTGQISCNWNTVYHFFVSKSANSVNRRWCALCFLDVANWDGCTSMAHFFSSSLSCSLSLRFISFALPASFLLMAYWLIDVPDVFFFFLLPSPCNEISKFYSYSILRTGLHFRAVFRANTLFKTYDRWPWRPQRLMHVKPRTYT